MVIKGIYDEIEIEVGLKYDRTNKTVKDAYELTLTYEVQLIGFKQEKKKVDCIFFNFEKKKTFYAKFGLETAWPPTYSLHFTLHY